MTLEKLLSILEDHSISYTKVSDVCVLVHNVVILKDNTRPDETINLVEGTKGLKAVVSTVDNEELSLYKWLGY